MLPDGTSLPKQQGGVVNGREMHIDAVRIRVGLDLEVVGTAADGSGERKEMSSFL